MHRSDFFSLDTDSDTWALGIGRYRVPIRYQCLINKLYASLCGSDWDHSFMCKATSGLT